MTRDEESVDLQLRNEFVVQQLLALATFIDVADQVRRCVVVTVHVLNCTVSLPTIHLHISVALSIQCFGNSFVLLSEMTLQHTDFREL